MRNPRQSATVPMAFPATARASRLAPGRLRQPRPTLPFPAPRRPRRRRRDPDAPTKSLADVEMEYILQVYAKNGMNKQKTATNSGSA